MKNVKLIKLRPFLQNTTIVYHGYTHKELMDKEFDGHIKAMTCSYCEDSGYEWDFGCESCHNNAYIWWSNNGSFEEYIEFHKENYPHKHEKWLQDNADLIKQLEYTKNLPYDEIEYAQYLDAIDNDIMKIFDVDNDFTWQMQLSYDHPEQTVGAVGLWSGYSKEECLQKFEELLNTLEIPTQLFANIDKLDAETGERERLYTVNAPKRVLEIREEQGEHGVEYIVIEPKSYGKWVRPEFDSKKEC